MKLKHLQKLLILVSVIQLTFAASIADHSSELETTTNSNLETTTNSGGESTTKSHEESTTNSNLECNTNSNLETTTEIETTSVIETTTNSQTSTDLEETTIEIIDDHTTTTPTTVSLEVFATQQMNFVLNHILRTLYEFVTRVLQETPPNSLKARDKLKSYAEQLLRILQYDEQTEVSYTMLLRKLTFLRGKSTAELPTHLPKEWLAEYHKAEDEVSVWLDKTAEHMHDEFTKYVPYDDDHVKHQYFNETFDDISRANKIQLKLRILMDVVKVATNKKQISYLDLYMQT